MLATAVFFLLLRDLPKEFVSLGFMPICLLQQSHILQKSLSRQIVYQCLEAV